MDKQNSASIPRSVCQLFHKQLMEYPLDEQNTGLRSVLDLLYTAYAETQTDNPEEIKQAYQRLDDLLQDVSFEMNNAVFSIVSKIQCSTEERTFLDGVRIGAHLVKELYAG